MIRTKQRAIAMTKRMANDANEYDSIKHDIQGKTQQTTTAIQIIVLFVVICFVPTIIWKSYFQNQFPVSDRISGSNSSYEVNISHS